MGAGRTKSVPAVERGLTILEALSKSRHGLTLSQLTRYLRLPKSSVHCLLVTFDRCGYVQHDPHSGRYRLGLRLFDLANLALHNVGLREEAAPVLRELMETTQLTVHLAILEQDDAVVVEKVEPSGPVRVATWVGRRMDLHCTALGKAMLAELPEEAADRLLRKHGMLRHNENTIASLRRLKQELAVIRQRGYAVDDEEEEIGFRCVGAAVHGSDGTLAAVSVSGTADQIDVDNLALLAERVKAAAGAVSARQPVSHAPAMAGQAAG